MTRRRFGLVVGLAVLVALLAWRLGSRTEEPVPREEARRAEAAAAEVPREVPGPAEPTPPVPAPAAKRMTPGFAGRRHPRGSVDVRVRVIDVDDTPAVGATVHLLRATREGWTDVEPVAVLRADNEGRARVALDAAPDFRIHATLAGRTGWAQASTSSETVVRLEECLPVCGRVVDTSGQPVWGAEVVLSLAGPITGPGSFRAASVSVTDERGEVAIPRRDVHPHPYYRVTARGYATAWGELDRSSLLAGGFEIRLDPVVTVEGRFVDANGRPVAGVQVWIVETMEGTRSGHDGHFCLPGLPQRGGTLLAMPREHGIVRQAGLQPRGNPTDLGDVRLGAGESIRGRVLRADGTPAVSASVRAYDHRAGLSSRAASADGDGRFELTGLADTTYHLAASAGGQPLPGMTTPSAECPAVAAGTNDVTLTLRPRPALRIALVSDTGLDLWVRRVEVRATRRGDGATVEKDAESKLRKRRTSSFFVVLPAAGTYDVVVRAPGHGERTVVVTVEPGELRTVPVTLPDGDAAD